MEGIAKAKENNVRFGAKSNLNDEQIQEMKQKRIAGVLIKDLIQE